MGNGERVQIPDGTHTVEGCTKSTGPHGFCLQLDIDGRQGLSPLIVDEHIDPGKVVEVEDNEVVSVIEE